MVGQKQKQDIDGAEYTVHPKSFHGLIFNPKTNHYNSLGWKKKICGGMESSTVSVNLYHCYFSFSLSRKSLESRDREKNYSFPLYQALTLPSICHASSVM